ncbi:LOW QUALITY PROTEIN: hypothetical protein Cgig2_003563 [Carnegiea gigantea]|uniref:Uncharacterized protein n=1 Tax=Carnegiea gigantea TaxID=171969 RepID=A0A9Q1JX24_9CARY|nr:LOW QUALITY PROTEIN: hypothetical protein Cgig2_003563 [Carnegiea gigantea]
MGPHAYATCRSAWRDIRVRSGLVLIPLVTGPLPSPQKAESIQNGYFCRQNHQRSTLSPHLTKLGRDKVAHSQFYNVLGQVRLRLRSSKPSLVENLKIGKIFLLSSYIKVKENISSYQLLRHDIESGHKLWAGLPLYGEFSYKPLYWGWLENILVFELIRIVCEYWCPETNTLHTSKGEGSVSIFDSYNFLRLPLSRHLYDEVVPT